MTTGTLKIANVLHQFLTNIFLAWTRFFLPVIETKHLSKYVVDYLETTLRYVAQ